MIKSNPCKVNKTEFQSPDGKFVLNPFINAFIRSVIPNVVKTLPKTINSFDKKFEVLNTLIRVMAEEFFLRRIRPAKTVKSLFTYCQRYKP